MDEVDLRIESAPAVRTLPGLARAAPEIHSAGCVSASVSRNPGAGNSFALLTVHDVGMSSVSCFQTFFNYARSSSAVPELFALAAHVHVQIQGHDENAQRVPAADSWASMADYADSLAQLVHTLSLDRVVLLGVGAGGDLCTRFALKHPERTAGIILVGASLRGGGWRVRKEAASLWWYRDMSEAAKDWFMARWISTDGGDLNTNLTEKLLGSLERMEPVNVGRYLHAYATADHLDIDRRVLRKGTRVLLVIGKDAPDHAEAKAALLVFDTNATSIVDLDRAGTLVMEERPAEVATAIRLFFHGLGIILHDC